MARGTDDMGYIAFVDDLKKHGLKPSNKVNFIELIWIEKEFRGKGYASAGLDDIIEAYKEDGAGHLMLSVGQEGGLENKDLIKFYKRHGFVPLEGSIENSVRKYNPTMILDLKQNKLAKGGELPKGGDCYKSAGVGDIETNNPKKYQKYTIPEARAKMLKTKNYGSWDIETDFEKGGKTYNDKELLEKWEKGESIGFTGEAHLKAKGLIPRADGTKRKSEKYMAKPIEIKTEVKPTEEISLQKADGGQASQEINCVNCGWKWETADSDKEDMYLCHQCGFDNTLYYSDIMSKLKKPMSVSEISQKHGVNTQYIENQLDVGINHELEHTDDEGVAKIIALHHIGEKPNYYELVEKYKLEDGGQPSKFWHQADQYEIADFIQNERMATEELLCSGDTRIAKAIICRAKIDIAEQKEQKSNNLEEKMHGLP